MVVEHVAEVEGAEVPEGEGEDTTTTMDTILIPITTTITTHITTGTTTNTEWLPSRCFSSLRVYIVYIFYIPYIFFMAYILHFFFFYIFAYSFYHMAISISPFYNNSSAELPS